jgi:NAD(P)-dependent dehydrogenase (short-subunit alcohol dehydrogenase family)
MSKKTVLITGASSGIGQAISQALRQDHWKIIEPSHTELDLSDPAGSNTYAKNLKSKISHLDSVIHIAGIWHDEHEVLADKQLSEFTSSQIIATMNVGLVSLMVMLANLLPIIKVGTIIGISGTFENGAAGWLAYYTSKRALEDFLVGLSQDYPKVRTFGISPSDTATPAYGKFYPQYIAESQSPEVVAALAVQLLSSDNEFQSGDIVEVKQAATRIGFHT